MKYTVALVFMLVDGLLLISALPQGGYQSQRPSSYGGSSSSTQGSCCGGSASASSSSNYGTSELQGSSASFSSQSLAPQSNNFGAFGGGGGGGGGGSGGNLNVECKRQEVSPGRFKFVCEGVNPNSISLRSEHVLWLTGPEGQKQVVDIEVPNYKIEELIKAGFKTSPGEGTLINVLLRKPEQSYDAQVDTIPPAGGTPSVNLQYEPVEKTLVHFPNDKPYSPLTGPILPPLAGGRPQRQVQKQFSKPYSQVQVQQGQQTQQTQQQQQVQRQK